jgi:hypothetical protein
VKPPTGREKGADHFRADGKWDEARVADVEFAAAPVNALRDEAGEPHHEGEGVAHPSLARLAAGGSQRERTDCVVSTIEKKIEMN